MSRQFSLQRGPTRVVFAAGAAARVADEIAALGFERVAVISTPGRKSNAVELEKSLGSRAVGVIATAREHVPVAIVEDAQRDLTRLRTDAVLAFGGGSAIGLAKALALTSAVRVAAMPTTYSGSEMTAIYGTTENSVKKTGRDERVRPVLVVYDPSLTRELPRETRVLSLWNAIAHAVEALWSKQIDRSVALTAEEALRLLAKSLLDDDYELALEGAYLAGAAFADAGSGIHHKLCHLLGGMFGLPHAATHAALLPHVVRFQRETEPEAMAAIARALGVIDPVEGILALSRQSGAPADLESIGMPRDGIARVAGFEKLLESAWHAPRSIAQSAPQRAPETLAYQTGFGSTHESEALEGALPRRQNAPRPAPHGLYPELLSGTPFTVKSAENSRVWMYRIRPSYSHTELIPLPRSRFTAPLGETNPNRIRWQPLPVPEKSAPVDFLDGTVTLGGAGDPTAGPGYRVTLYAANSDMRDRCFSTADGDLLIVPQLGGLECRTELGYLRAAPGSILVIPRGLKFAIGLTDGTARGWMLEVFGRRLRLPERGPIGSNGLADARHFLAPTASYEDRSGEHQIVTKVGDRLYAATQDHSPFDVVAWHGNHVPFSYDLSLFNAMGSVTWDHPDPSILTVLTAPLDDHGRAVADFVVFPPRWQVAEHSFRPPFMHRNAASELNLVVKNPPGDYDPGCTFLTPLLTAHGVSTKTYDAVLSRPDDQPDVPERGSNQSLWCMFESALPFCLTAWARETPLIDPKFGELFAGMRSRFSSGKGSA